jgi:AcrR family transcriptional regulator
MTAAERDTADKILIAAAELFAERGYKGTTTRAIAERAGVNEVTVFRRFKNKLGVLKALGESWAQSMAGFAVGTLPDPSDTRGTLETLARLEIAQAISFGEVATRLAMEAKTSPEIAEVMGEGPGDNFAGLATYLGERQAAGDLRTDLDPRVMAEAFFALTSSLVMSRQLLGRGATPADVPMEDVSQQVLELYLTGIGLKATSIPA